MSSKVFLIKLKDGADAKKQAEAMAKLYDHCNLSDMIEENNFVAIKLHVGDKDNSTYIRPEIAAVLARKAKEKDAHPFMTETSTLYKGVRSNAVSHIMHADSHGFTIQKVGAPFIMADGLSGNLEIEVEINGILNKKVRIAREARMTDCMFVVSHPTGHMVTGYGGAIKNLGMGLASRKGKLKQHSIMDPEIHKDKCVMCGRCIEWCPEDAIIKVDGKAFIVREKCVGCGECLAVCQFGAVKFDWGVESGDLQKHMAEHALGVVKGKESKIFYFNIAINMTKECDCLPGSQKKFIPDVGIFASSDPIAIDEATLDLTTGEDGLDLSSKSFGNLDGRIQLEHGQKIGLGHREYELVELEEG
ncbi:MAG: DUF362 domain-containing protein [Candidatus Eremiobacteraeota bacterium]|nr:DUF362 domain-containing protein [Candidatus Eremiobacteraeota bacterium]